MEAWVIGTGLGAGALLVVTVCLGWLLRKEFGTAGVAMCTSGVILIGLSVFKTASIDLAGLTLAFDTTIEAVSDNAGAVGEELTALTATVSAQGASIEEILTKLEQKNVVDASAAGAVRNALAKSPRVDPGRLRQATERLSEISSAAAQRIPKPSPPHPAPAHP